MRLWVPNVNYRKRWRKSLLALCVLCLIFVSNWSAEVRAQSDSERRHTLVAIDISLSEAFDRFIEESGVNVAFDFELIEGKKAYCRAIDQKLEDVFRCLLEGTDLDFIRLSSGTYVLIERAKAPPAWGDLTGRVVDLESGEPLPNAHVLLADAGTGEVTNNAGRFSFARLKPGRYYVVVTYIGYSDLADSIYVQPNTNTRIELGMQSEPIVTSPIVVNGLMRRLPSEKLATEEGDALELTESPGANDLIRSLNTIVGIRVGDSMGDVHVQGGDAGEHQYRLDGVPVFVPIPNGGIVGPFSPFALDKFTVHKAGFGATQGSHLSGVIEVEHRLTPLVTNTFDVQVDPLSVNGRVMGSIGNRDKLGASWMIAARKGLWSLYQPQGLANHFSEWSQPDLFLLETLVTHNTPPSERNNYFESIERAFRQEYRENSFQDRFDFFDTHAAARIHLGPLKSLHASLYLGGNLLGDEEVIRGRNRGPGEGEVPREDNFLRFENTFDWTNTVASLRYEHIVGHRTFVEWSGWYSGYDFDQNFDQEDYEDDGEHPEPGEDDPRPPSFSPDSLAAWGFSTADNNNIAEFGFRSEINRAFGNRHFLTAGLEGIRAQSEFVLDLQVPRNFGQQRPGQARLSTTLWRWTLYAEDRYSFSEKTTLNAGIRLTYLHDNRQVLAEPRLALRHDVENGPLGAWAFRAAVGLYRQYINQFDVTAISVNALLPSVRFWLPLSDGLSPPKSYHASGALLAMPSKTWEIRVEGYYKWQPLLHIIDYVNPNLFDHQNPTTTRQDELLTRAEGYAFGGAVSVRKKTDYLTLTSQYEYSAAEQKIENRFDNEIVGVPWNVPHRITASLDFTATDRLTFLARLQYSIGQSWAFRNAYYNYLEPSDSYQNFGIYDLSDPESHQLPINTQLDLGISYAQRLKGVDFQARLELANVLSATNVEEWSLIYHRRSEQYVKIERPISPFLPSLVLRVGW